MADTNGDSDKGPKRFKKDASADPFNPEPSIVVHVRNLSTKATEADLLEALSHFGLIAYATSVPHKRMALVEFEDINSAQSCVEFAQHSQIFVAGQPALFNYSTSKMIQRIGLECEKPNHVVILTIHNAQYPITADIIYQICKTHGDVKRVAIIRRSGVQALVEFGSTEAARTAKLALNGADIYSGCCTIKIEYARAETVRISRTDSEQWDYTLGAAGEGEKRPGLLSKDNLPYNAPYNGPPLTGNKFGTAYAHPQRTPVLQGYGNPPPPPAQNYSAPNPTYGHHNNVAPAGYDSNVYHHQPYQTNYNNDHNTSYEQQGDNGELCTIMVYGIDQEKLNCDKLFNLFCQYGNVIRIKFMKSKTDTAMVQMGDSYQVQSLITNLLNVTFDGQTLALKVSNQPTLRDIKDPFPLPDGEASYKYFFKSRNNRYSTPEAAQRNRVCHPTRFVHWYNAPGTMTTEKITQILSANGCNAPTKVAIFPIKSERSSNGIAEYASVEDATSAIVNNNHTPVDSPLGKIPYIVKLAFSTPKSERQ